MAAPVTEEALYSALSGYASTLEVQFMIEEELKKFQEKTLPRLLAEKVHPTGNSSSNSGALDSGSAAAERPVASGGRAGEAPHRLHDGVGGPALSAPSPSSSFSSLPSHGGTPDTEWVRTFLKAHIDDTVARRLPTMIAQEVQRQLRGVTAASPSPPRDVPAKTSSSSGGGGDLRSAMGLPPLPPPLPSAPGSPSSPLTTSSGIGSGGYHGGGAPSSSSPASPPPTAASEEARRQREQILRAIDDIESQVNQLQRVVDAAVVERGVWASRWAYLGAVLTEHGAVTGDYTPSATQGQPQEGETGGRRGSNGSHSGDAAAAAGMSVLPLHLHLERLLDEHREAALLHTLGALVQSVLPQRHDPAASPSEEGPSVAFDRPPLRSPSQFLRDASASAASPVLSARRRRNSLSLEPPYPSHRDGTPEPSPRRVSDPTARASLFASAPPSPPPTSPPGGTTTRLSSSSSNNHAREAAAAAAAAAAGETAAAAQLVERPLKRPPLTQQQQQQQHHQAVGPTTVRTAATRSITTKGSAATSPSSGSASMRSLHTDTTTTTTTTAVPHLDGGRHNGLDGTAVRRPAALPRDVAAATRTGTPHRSRRRWEDEAEGENAAGRSDETSSILPVPTSRHRSTHRASASASSQAVDMPAITLGIDAVNVPPGVLPDALGRHGAVCVQSVTPRQLAERAGLHRGDVLLSLDHRSVRSCEQLRDVLAAVPPTQGTIAVELYRHSAHQIITLHLKL